MEAMNLQLMSPNCKPVHTRAYTVPISVEQQLQDWWTLKSLNKIISLNGLPHHFQFIPKKIEQ
jgi:hypothetical protein